MNKYIIDSNEENFCFESEADEKTVRECLKLLVKQDSYDYEQLIDMLNVLCLKSNQCMIIYING